MKSVIQFIVCVAAISALSLSCLGADVAVLRNGFSIRHERRQVIGNITRLFVDGDNSSFVDVPTAEIDHFEAAPDPVPPASTPASQPTPQAAAKTLPQPMGINELVNSASGTYNLDPDLVNSVIHAESGFNVRAVSPKGAQGLMQLMPQTASALGVQNAFDPQANVEGGTRYLRELLERYNFDLIKALAAYNAGPERVEQYGGVPPYYETKAYVARVVRDFNKKKLAQQKNATQTADAASRKTAAVKKPNSRTNTKPGTATAKSQSSGTSVQASVTGSR